MRTIRAGGRRRGGDARGGGARAAVDFYAIVGLVVVLAVVALPGAAVAEVRELEPRGIGRVCPIPGEDQFDDLDTTHAAAISCAADYGLVSGFSDGTFKPNQGITRQQMASFVVAWVQTAVGLSLPLPDDRRFDDVEEGVHADAIDALAEAEIIGGRADGSFGPTEILTRGQFTRAVANAISYADVLAVGGPLPPPDTTVTFTDVDGSPFADTIVALAGSGVAVGTGEGEFRPSDPVTRGQLSTFLMRAADLLDEYQRWQPTALAPVALRATLFGEVAEGSDPDQPVDGEAGTAAGDGTDGDGSGTDDGSEVTPALVVVGELDLVVDAFGSLLRFELSQLAPLGPYEPAGGLTLHLGDPDTDPDVVLQLATGAALDEVTEGELTGTVFEAASSVRFVELLREVDQAYVQLATAAEPDGAARSRLELAPR